METRITIQEQTEYIIPDETPLFQFSTPSFTYEGIEYFKVNSPAKAGVSGTVEQYESKDQQSSLAIKSPHLHNRSLENFFSYIDATLVSKAVHGVGAFCKIKNNWYVLMPFFKGIDLFDFIEQKSATLNDKDLLKILKILINTVIHFHKKGFVHGDLKSSNIIVVELNSKFHLKIIDFDATASIGLPTIGFTNTPKHHMAPELGTGILAEPNQDVFRVGSTLVSLFPFKKEWMQTLKLNLMFSLQSTLPVDRPNLNHIKQILEKADWFLTNPADLSTIYNEMTSSISSVFSHQVYFILNTLASLPRPDLFQKANTLLQPQKIFENLKILNIPHIRDLIAEYIEPFNEVLAAGLMGRCERLPNYESEVSIDELTPKVLKKIESYDKHSLISQFQKFKTQPCPDWVSDLIAKRILDDFDIDKAISFLCLFYDKSHTQTKPFHVAVLEFDTAYFFLKKHHFKFEATLYDIKNSFAHNHHFLHAYRSMLFIINNCFKDHRARDPENSLWCLIFGGTKDFDLKLSDKINALKNHANPILGLDQFRDDAESSDIAPIHHSLWDAFYKSY